MQCPRCHIDINVRPDPGGSILCPGCGAKLMTRATALRTGGGRPGASPSGSDPGLEAHHPSATLPPGTPLKKIPRPGEDTARSAARPAPAALETPAAGTAAVSRPGSAAAPGPSPGGERGAPLDQVLAELREIRETQRRILALLQSPPGEAPADGEALGAGIEDPAALPPVRTRRRKSVLLIDDDPSSRDAALAELEQAQVPARAAADGNAGIQAIAAEKPDVIALELGIGGNMAGKDVINMIKATMEWVDIPIVLYTRLPLESQKEARTVHGADDLVYKRSGPAALVSRVITLFRRAS